MWYYGGMCPERVGGQELKCQAWEGRGRLPGGVMNGQFSLVHSGEREEGEMS